MLDSQFIAVPIKVSCHSSPAQLAPPIMSATVESVVKAKAIQLSQLLMPPGHKIDSNADQLFLHHSDAFVVRDFLRKAMC
jgi:hypothetical protein